jgi:hypothetical protein
MDLIRPPLTSASLIMDSGRGRVSMRTAAGAYYLSR